MKNLQDYILNIPDFPEKGIIFRDITSLLSDPEGFSSAVDMLAEKLENTDFDVIGALESRGFIFAAPLAYKLKKPLILVRKKGKLPRETISQKYSLEYGEAEFEIHVDDVKAGQKVVLIDDLLATGGSINAAAQLFERLGASVSCIMFIIELIGLRGRDNLNGYRCESLVVYD